MLTDDLVGRVGIAYSGSNPSFEIRIPTTQVNTEIVSVDLKDSRGISFKSIPFKITKISGSPDKLIFGLSIPDSVNKGELRFALNLITGSSLTGIIQILSPLEIQVPSRKNGKNLKNISKPIINRITMSKSGRKVELLLRGKSFAPSEIYYQEGTSTRFLANLKTNPHTLATVFPSSLNIELKKRIVSKNSKNMQIKFNLQRNVEQNTSTVLVLSTPRGIDSISFTLKPKSKKKKE